MAVLKIRPQALTLVAVVVSPMLTMFYAFYTERQDNFCHAINRDNEHFKALNYYCNSIEIPINGSEGDLQEDGFNLESIQVVLRHGDRTRIHNLPNYDEPQLACHFSNYPHLFPHTQGLDGFVEVMERNSLFKNIIPETLSRFELYPNEDICRFGQLTPTGAAQQVKNGAFLRMKYRKWDLFESDDDTISNNFKLVSTQAERTFQSGIAFMYGIMPSFNLSAIEVEAATNSSMCIEKAKRTLFPCSCSIGLEKYSKFTAHTFGLTFAGRKKKQAPYDQIAVAFNIKVSDIPSAQSLMDVGMTHMCHRLPLPGSPSKCLEVGTLRHLVDEANYHGDTQSKSGDYPYLAKSRMLPFIDQIYSNMLAVLKDEERVKVIVYSGHDTTLEPLLVALNISSGEWPKYAARVVFELYSYKATSSSDKSYFFRILYNGHDRTSKAIGCSDSLKNGLCPLQVLGKFLEESASLCNPSKKT